MGTLFYVVGASGVGKDSLLAYARARLNGKVDALFAHRYITRPVDAGGENHVAVNRAEFTRMQSLGLFALHWESHGLQYGVGKEIDQWLNAGAHVVMNGSRAHLPATAVRYPDLCVVHIEASPAVLRARLEQRARESVLEIEERVRRASQFTVQHPGTVVISNNGSLPEAGERLVALLRSPSSAFTSIHPSSRPECAVAAAAGPSL
jgi:ribose 1,5-bisphosphokinase